MDISYFIPSKNRKVVQNLYKDRITKYSYILLNSPEYESFECFYEYNLAICTFDEGGGERFYDVSCFIIANRYRAYNGFVIANLLNVNF